MANEELIFRLSMLQQQAEEIRQQIEAVNTQTLELEALSLSLEKLKSKKGEDMLANLGKGIFINTKIDDDKLLVNVGNKILLRKSIPETYNLINNQIKEMGELKTQLFENFQSVNHELEHMINHSEHSHE